MKRTKSQKRKQKDGIGHRFPRVRRFVLWWPFEVYHGLVICANCISIGYIVDHDEVQGTLPIFVIEQYFTFTFFTELLMRTLCKGWMFPLLKENHLDVFLVSLSVLNTWILGPAGVDPGMLKKMSVLRILRLVRLARSLRFRPEFHDMWQLMRGLVESAATLFWCYIMIGCVLYFFAIVGVSTIGKAERLSEEGTEHGAVAQEYFGSLMLTMMTLFQVMTVDSWTGVMRPMMDVQPMVVVFFVFFISVSVFILTNLIIAVIVENAFDSAKEDQQELAKELELQREQELEELSAIFHTMDLDGSGMVDKDEVAQAMQIRHVRMKLRILDVNLEDMSALWEILDDGDGELDVDEFIAGMRRMKGEGKAKDVMRLLRELRIQEATVARLDAKVRSSVARLAPAKAKVRRTMEDLGALRRTMERANQHLKHAAQVQVLTPAVEDLHEQLC